MNHPEIQKLSAFASASKLKRLLHHPARYLTFLWKSKVLPKTGFRKSSLAEAITFWGDPVTVSLPSSSDIFLAGGKTHDSEIRLAQWIINHIHDYTEFLDIGAHVGYFSLLAAHFSGTDLTVQSFEPARSAFALLQKNTAGRGNIVVHQAAIGATAGEAVFHEFPHEYAEYSSLVMDNYEGTLKTTLQKSTIDYTVPILTLDDILQPVSKDYDRILVKIDTEGNELAVLQGAGKLLQTAQCDFVIEFLANGNPTYKQAETLLQEAGYEGCLIDADGNAVVYPSVAKAMQEQKLESENVLFRKKV